MNDGFETVSLLCPLSVEVNPDNTNNWKDIKLPSFPKLVELFLPLLSGFSSGSLRGLTRCAEEKIQSYF